MSDYAIKDKPFNPFGLNRLISYPDLSLLNKKRIYNDYYSDSLLNTRPVNAYTETINAEQTNEVEEVMRTEEALYKKYYLSLIKEIEVKKDSIIQEYDFSPPNEYVFNFSRNFISNLIENKILTFDITPSAEEGMCFVFRNNHQVLYFEIYNDKEMGYIIENEIDKKILENKNIESEEEIIKRVISF